MEMGVYVLWWIVIFSSSMLARRIYLDKRDQQDREARRAQEDLGMERWHQQDLAEWDALFEKEVGHAPFPSSQGIGNPYDWQYHQQNALRNFGTQNNFSRLLQPGLQNAFQAGQVIPCQQNQLGALGVGLGGLMAQQAQQGVFDLDKAHAELRQQEIIAGMLGRDRH